MSEDRCQRKDDGEQKTEDRQKADDRKKVGSLEGVKVGAAFSRD